MSLCYEIPMENSTVVAMTESSCFLQGCGDKGKRWDSQNLESRGRGTAEFGSRHLGSLVPGTCRRKTPELVKKPLRRRHGLPSAVTSGIQRRIQTDLRRPCQPAGFQTSVRSWGGCSGEGRKTQTGNWSLLGVSCYLRSEELLFGWW